MIYNNYSEIEMIQSPVTAIRDTSLKPGAFIILYFIAFAFELTSHVHSQGHTKYIMKFFITSKNFMHKYQQNSHQKIRQNKGTIKTLGTERLRSVRFITVLVTHLVWLIDLLAKLHPCNKCKIKRTSI